MSQSERTLLATITAHTIARRQPRTETELEAARSEADEIAAETIGAARTERAFSEAEGEPPPAREGWTAKHYEYLAAAAKSDAMMFDDEEDPTAEE